MPRRQPAPGPPAVRVAALVPGAGAASGPVVARLPQPRPAAAPRAGRPRLRLRLALVVRPEPDAQRTAIGAPPDRRGAGEASGPPGAVNSDAGGRPAGVLHHRPPRRRARPALARHGAVD